ncbi:MAG TPA: BON domain-containing protein [Verrucomicrobiae bacterium]|jgi:osmotically-inducible protein OsmY|nr:BON domain-containing protein [Verrucomicrobiae bacterium]
MKNYPVKLALLALFALAVVQASGGQAQPQSQDQQPQTQPTEAPPHVDHEPSPDDRALEDTIKKDLGQDAHMAYSRVTVHVTDAIVELDGVVLTSTAKEQAAKIAAEHAGGRKVKNKLKVNPNTHPSGA